MKYLNSLSKLSVWRMVTALILGAIFLAGCNQTTAGVGTGGTGRYTVKGAVQKGPLIVGTPVYVNKLDGNGNASESTTITEIKDSLGSFSFQINSPGAVQIVATGYYFNEVTGQISSNILTLKAIYEVSSQTNQTSYVNILTHLINGRVISLLKSGNTVSEAINKAQTELVTALNQVLSVQNIPSFNVLSIYNTDSDNKVGNAYLLALSSAFYKYAELKAQGQNTSSDAQLSLILNLIANDFAADGAIDQAGFIEDLTTALRSLNPKGISENLQNRSKIDLSQPVAVPDITMFFGLCAGNADCSWSTRAPMPIAKRGHSSANYKGNIYTFGGLSPFIENIYNLVGPSSIPFDEVFVYDTATNQWESKTRMPVGLYGSKAHTIGDKIYVFGGYGAGGLVNTVREYDPNNDTWSMKSPMPTYRSIFMSEVVDGKVYVVGGQGTVDNGPSVSGKPWENKQHVEIYDPITDRWSMGNPAPTVLAGAASCAAGSNIFIFGGNAGSLQSYTYVYDTLSGIWEQKSSSPTAREGHKCVVVGDKFVLMGGRNIDALDKLEIYTPDLDAWKEYSYLPTARYWFTTDLVDGFLYILGGLGNNYMTPLDSVEVFNTSHLSKNIAAAKRVKK